MQPVRIIILALAALAAIAAVFIARNFSGSAPVQQVVQAPAQPAIETVRVLVAGKDLSIGSRVGDSDLQWADWPKSSVHASFMTEQNAPEAATDYVDAVARVDISAGEPLTPRKIIKTGDAGFMAAVLEPGMRAVAVPISAETGAGGFILPNDRVDVIVTRSGAGDGGRDSFVSETVLRNVRVLAIDQTFKEVDDEEVVVGSTATLELTPSQAEALNLSVATGEIALSLRSVADIEYEAPLSDVPRVASAQNVRVIRYGAQSNVQIEGN